VFEHADLAEITDRCRKAALDDADLATDDELYEAVVEVASARAALDACEAHLLSALEVRGACDRDHGLSTARWLADRTQIPRAVAATRVRVAVKLRAGLGQVDEALRDGRICADHARVLADAANPRIAHEIVGAQGELVDAAERAPFDLWRRQVGALVELLDQDGGYDPERERARNRLHLDPMSPDHLVVSGELVGEPALLVRQILQAEADRLWRRCRDDHEQCDDLTIPSRSTLLALALAEVCRRATASATSGSSPGQAPATDLTLVLQVDRPDEIRTVDGDPLARERYDHLLCDPIAHLLRVDGRGIPLDLGRAVRFATPGQRRALAVRDGSCVFPGCDAPVTWCEAHHVRHFEDGGRSDLANFALLCRHHHGVTHRQGWTMSAGLDQTFTWTTPTGRTLHGQRQHAPP
jgi:Domain of unknown function (DUF222)